MAGITSSFPFNPLLTRTSTKTTPSPFESKLFGVRLLCNPYAIKSNFISISSNRSGSITARYGGGFRSSGSGNSKRFRKSDPSDEDQALDISTVRSDIVRLIDDKQNMVGVVPKSEAIQMAVDAELDLVILSPDADPPVLKIMDYKFQKSY